MEADDALEILKEKLGRNINEFITNEDLINYGICNKCIRPNTGKCQIYTDDGSQVLKWCQSCNKRRFRRNFKKWTSGNNNVDEFIQRAQLGAKNHYQVIEWIEYNRFKDSEYLAKGGFGTTYKAIWVDGYICGWDSKNKQWKRTKGVYSNSNSNCLVALKRLHNSRDITDEFLREAKLLTQTNGLKNMVRLYGIAKYPDTNDFIMVMDYVEKGSLRQYLDNNFKSLNWKQKLWILHYIAKGLDTIHDNGLIHNDFHCGNILMNHNSSIFISDLGLCQPANSKTSKEVYGALPYVDPEVLRGIGCTQASDVYGFGIIAHEVCTGLPPYHDIAHETLLAVNICKGLRPKSDHKIPQLILNLIEQCWDANPLNRPTAKNLSNLLYKLSTEASYNSAMAWQIGKANKINEQSALSNTSISSNLSYTTHPQAVYTSRLLNPYTESLNMDFTKLDK